MGSGRFYVQGDLLFEGLYGWKSGLGSQVFFESDIENGAVQITGKIEEMDFQQTARSSNRGTRAQIGDPFEPRSIHGVAIWKTRPQRSHPHRPNSPRGRLNAFNRQVCGRKPELSSELITLCDNPADRIGPAKHGGRLGEIAIMDCLTDPGAADPVPVIHHRSHRLHTEPEGIRLASQKRNVAAAVPAKPPVLANCNGFDRCGSQPAEKICRLHRGEFAVEVQCHEYVEAEAGDDALFVIEGREQRRRSPMRGDHPDRMRIEGDHTRQSTVPPGGSRRA